MDAPPKFRNLYMHPIRRDVKKIVPGSSLFLSPGCRWHPSFDCLASPPHYADLQTTHGQFMHQRSDVILMPGEDSSTENITGGRKASPLYF
jgi:hypothetical protein